jgi:hypothetical protein
VDDANTKRRMRLAQALLGLKPGEAVSTEQQKMSLATAAVILSDMIGHIQRAAKARGSGMAVVRPDGDLAWFSAEEVVEQLDLAVRIGDSALASTFRDLVSLLENLDPDDHIILAMATGAALRVFKIPIDDPSGFLRKLLAEWGR